MRDKSMEVQWRRTLALVASGTGRHLLKRQRAKTLGVLTLLGFCVVLVLRSSGGQQDEVMVVDGMLVNDFGENDRLLVPEYRYTNSNS